jgi:hypothetical protein
MAYTTEHYPYQEELRYLLHNTAYPYIHLRGRVMMIRWYDYLTACHVYHIKVDDHIVPNKFPDIRSALDYANLFVQLKGD